MQRNLFKTTKSESMKISFWFYHYNKNILIKAHATAMPSLATENRKKPTDFRTLQNEPRYCHPHPQAMPDKRIFSEDTEIYVQKSYAHKKITWRGAAVC
jgi:hypothetical protein